MVFNGYNYTDQNIWFDLNTSDSQWGTFNLVDGRESSTTATVALQLETYLDTYGYGVKPSQVRRPPWLRTRQRGKMTGRVRLQVARSFGSEFRTKSSRLMSSR